MATGHSSASAAACSFNLAFLKPFSRSTLSCASILTHASQTAFYIYIQKQKNISLGLVLVLGGTPIPLPPSITVSDPAGQEAVSYSAQQLETWWFLKAVPLFSSSSQLVIRSVFTQMGATLARFPSQKRED